MRLTGGARNANGTTGYTTNYGLAQALLTNGRPFAAGEGIVVTGTIRGGTDVAVGFGESPLRGAEVWHLRRSGHRLKVTIPPGANNSRLTLDGRLIRPNFRIAPGARLRDASVESRFATDRDGFLRTLREGGDVCQYLDESTAKKMTSAKCEQLRAQMAKELSWFLPLNKLVVTFWDYNGEILAIARPGRDSPSSRDREVWKLQSGRFRVSFG